MKKAIKVPGSAKISQQWFDKLRSEACLTKYPHSKTIAGEVDSLRQPIMVNEVTQSALNRLNSLYDKPKYKFREKSKTHSSLAVGVGSVPSHKDSITRLSLVTFLGVITDGNIDTGGHLIQEAELHTTASSLELKVGESALFDDSETHSWLSNACWVLAVDAVEKV